MSEIYLEQFDSLDLSIKEHRRIGVYLLHEYFGSVMWNVGRNHLRFDEGWKRQNVRDQWEHIETRLDVIGGVDVPEEFRQIGDRVYSARSDVAHNKKYDPDQSNLSSIRELAPAWQEWLTRQAESFIESRGQVSPYEGIVDLILKNIEIVKRRPMPANNPIAMAEAREIKTDAEVVRDRVESIDHDYKNLEKLTQLLMHVITLRKDMHNLSRDPSDYVDPPGPDEPLFYERIDDWEGGNDWF